MRGGRAGAEGESLADHVARDSAVRLQGDPTGPALTEAEFRMAAGAFDPDRFEEYNRQVRTCRASSARQGGPVVRARAADSATGT